MYSICIKILLLLKYNQSLAFVGKYYDNTLNSKNKEENNNNEVFPKFFDLRRKILKSICTKVYSFIIVSVFLSQECTRNKKYSIKKF